MNMNAYLALYSTKNRESQFSFPIERKKQGYNQVCCPKTKMVKCIKSSKSGGNK
jgi:hypothetical protein